MNEYPVSTRPVRKTTGSFNSLSARFGATFFITICCEARAANQLCREDITRVLFETGRCYHDTQKRYLKILLLMPDHLHVLVGIPGNADLSNLLRDFKRVTATIARIHWQRNCFDHRLRHDESEAEKFEYIRQNPVRAGLIVNPWRHSNRCEFRGFSRCGSNVVHSLFLLHLAMISSTICFGSRPRSIGSF
jgi:putative transposase